VSCLVLVYRTLLAPTAQETGILDGTKIHGQFVDFNEIWHSVRFSLELTSFEAVPYPLGKGTHIWTKFSIKMRPVLLYDVRAQRPQTTQYRPNTLWHGQCFPTLTPTPNIIRRQQGTMELNFAILHPKAIPSPTIEV